MKNIKTILAFFTLAILSSCVNDSFDDPKDKECISSGLVSNKTVASVYAVAINPIVVNSSVSTIPNTPTYATDDVIEGYVISSDEGGNFYQSMYFQPIDGSKGFNLSVNIGNVYTKGFAPGQKVFLKLKGLGFGNPTSFGVGLIFGAPPTDKYTVDRLSALDFPKYLFPACEGSVNEDDIVKKITLAQAKAANNPYLNTLVEFDNVQFDTEGITYDTDRTDLFDSSINITDGTTNFVVRTSRFANFAGNVVPSGRGKIRGVLTKYNGTYQIILRTERDVKFSEPRTDYATPIGGSAIVYSGGYTENFESYAVTSNGAIFPKYVNDAFIGSRYWDVKSFGTNKYIQMSSFGSGGNNKTYLAMPVDFTTASNFSFKTKDGFNRGNVLKVYYSRNYVPGGNIAAASLVDITSSFNIASGTTTGYATNFLNSGAYAIPVAITGNGFFIFEYIGTSIVTTTIQLDDIVIN